MRPRPIRTRIAVANQRARICSAERILSESERHREKLPSSRDDDGGEGYDARLRRKKKKKKGKKEQAQDPFLPRSREDRRGGGAGVSLRETAFLLKPS